MNLLSVESLSKSYGDKLLFEDLNFGIHQNDRISLIAKNGTGKSTLLKILSGLEPPDEGRVVFRKGLSVGYLPQESHFNPDSSVIDAIFSSKSELFETVKLYESAIATDNHKEIDRLMSAMDRLDAWNLEANVRQVLGKLGITDIHQKTGNLSGGQVKRVALAKVLIENPGLLILDEPTNHLDIEMISWLEEFLNKSRITLFMVTHDRYFLDSVSNRIFELDRGSLYTYSGNYDYFVEKRQQRYEVLEAEKSKAQNLLKKEMEWYRRQPKARGTKSKARIDNISKIQESASLKTDEKRVAIDSVEKRLGSKILELHNIAKSFGDKTLFRNFYYKFQRNDKVGLVGPNGCGKTTFIKILLNDLKPDEGKVVWGETLKTAHYSQNGLQAANDKRVIEVVKDIAEYFELKKGKKISATQMLERFLFPREMHYQRVDKLSGGERKRLHLIEVLMQQPNFLILDEPTNDLDLPTISVLEDFLAGFNGCVVIASHDRAFLDNTVDHLFVFGENKTIKDFPGNYSQYQKSRKANKPVAASKKEPQQKRPERVKTKLSFNEKREFAEIEKKLPELEKEKAELEALLNAGNAGYEKLLEYTSRLNEVLEEIERLEMRWLELSEYA